AHGSLELRDVAYTLQVGRDAFAHRAAFLAASPGELVAQADAFLGAREVPGVLAGVAGPAPQEAGAIPAQPRDPEELAAAWVGGQPIGWTALHAGTAARRVSLPTHVFRAVRCWTGGAPDRRPKRVCVIGAGPGGLVMAKSLLEEGHEPVVFEKQA